MSAGAGRKQALRRAGYVVVIFVFLAWMWFCLDVLWPWYLREVVG